MIIGRRNVQALLKIFCSNTFYSLIFLSDVDQEEHLIVTAPVWDQDIFLSHNMGQDEPAVPTGGPMEVNIQTLEAEQTETLSEAMGSVQQPSAAVVEDTPKVAECTVPKSEPHQAPAPVLDADPVTDVVPALAPAPAETPATTQISEPDLFQISEPEASPAPEQKPETECIDLKQAEPTKKTKSSKPPSLKLKSPQNEPAETNEEQELPVPKGSYNFDLDQLDESFNPFMSGGPKIQNSPPPCGPSSLPRLEPLGSSLPICETSTAAPDVSETEVLSESKPVLLEFGMEEGTVNKPPPRKSGGKKTISKLGVRKQKPKVSEAPCKPAAEPTESETVSTPAQEPVSDPPAEPAVPVSDSSAPLNLDDIPITKTGTYNFDPSQWDDPNFNPFGSNSKMSGSPKLPKSSYNFDPDNFDDSVDPFKSSKTLSKEDSSSTVPQPEKKVKDGGKQTAAEKKVRQIPKKSKERPAK